MRTNAELVGEFHRAAGMEDPGVPSVPTDAVLELRERLISEECGEVMEAFARLREDTGGTTRWPI